MSNSGSTPASPSRRVPPLRAVPGYQRSMHQWYVHERPAYRAYMLREMTCLAVGYYALLLICALERLLAGEAAFAHFMTALRHPAWLLLNLLVLVAFVYHALTWFAVLPKTVPFIYVGGRRVPDAALTAAALGGFALASIAVLLAFWMSAP